MATRSTYECQTCNNQFDATRGNLMRSKEFRCTDCDTVEYVPHSEVNNFNHICKKCSGKMDALTHPMCSKCKGRNTKAVKLLVNID